MMSNFYIDDNKLEDVKSFISTLPTARFNHNPIKVDDKYYLSLTMVVQDGNKLSKYISTIMNIEKEKPHLIFL